MVADANDGLKRITAIVSDITAYARSDDGKNHIIDLNQCIDKALKLIWNEIHYTCQVEKNYTDNPKIQGNADTLVQVFINLFMNAHHAMPDEGTLTIKTGIEHEQVTVTIQDTGKGIPRENLSKVFDPFFTTKEAGKGTGLGLSIVYGIIQKHQGTIEVQSDVGKGTTFFLYFPRVSDVR